MDLGTKKNSDLSLSNSALTAANLDMSNAEGKGPEWSNLDIPKLSLKLLNFFLIIQTHFLSQDLSKLL